MTVVFTLTDHSSILLFVCLSSYPFQSFQNIENKTLVTTFIRYSLELTKLKFIDTVKKCVQFFSLHFELNFILLERLHLKWLVDIQLFGGGTHNKVLNRIHGS